ncbi:MAG: DUF5666 domain-containing protein [Anaerolineae bacterium]
MTFTKSTHQADGSGNAGLLPHNRIIIWLLAALLLAMMPALVMAQTILEHRGIVTTMPGGGGAGDWVIGGITFTATGATTFDVDAGPLGVGVCAEVEYVVEGSQNTAHKIASKSADDCGDQEVFEHTGQVQDMPTGGGAGDWVIGGVLFKAAAATTFDETLGALALDVCAKVHYSIQGAQNVATKIKTLAPGDCSSPNTHSVYGTIDSLPGDGLIGTWTVGGVEYVAIASTTFEQSDGPFAQGACVEVEYIVQNGQNIATHIETESSCDSGTLNLPLQKAHGILEAFPDVMTGTWTIGGVDYQATPATEFDEDHGSFAVGVCVKVKYVDQGGTLTALEIETESADDCGAPGHDSEFETTGLIEVMPTGTLSGTWVISGQTYTATLDTRFKQEHGDFEVGQCVKVEYWLNGSARIATKIETKHGHDCSGEQDENEVYGVIEALPGGGTLVLTGTWTIGGAQYVVDSNTKLEDGPFYVGLLVEVKFVRLADGTLLATKIEGKQEVDDDDKHTAKAYGLIEAIPTGNGTLNGTGTFIFTGTWTIGGIDYVANAETKFKQEHVPFGIGVCAKVRYRVEGSTNIALKIETKKAKDCQETDGSHSNRAYGFVDQTPPTGFVGTWIIGGEDYAATAKTKFKEEHGALVKGAFVKVKYLIEGGVKVAREIETHVPPEAGNVNDFGPLHIEGGVFRATGVPSQTWTIGGQNYQIIDATLLDDTLADFVDGQLVTVNAYNQNGLLFATRVNALVTQSVYLPLIRR